MSNETLFQLYTPARVQEAIDNDTWNLMTRYGVMHETVIGGEYYSHMGTFVQEAELTQQAGGSTLLDAKERLQTLQAQGQLPGLEVGMTWRSGFIRLSRLGVRPILLLPTQVMSGQSIQEPPLDAE